jgi:hypothetical protein
MIRLLHTGDLGDCIAALPILRALGGGDIVITEAKTNHPARSPRESMRGARFNAIREFLAAQPYVNNVEWQDEPTGITHDLSNFRESRIGAGENLALWQARYLGVSVSLEPWLIAPTVANYGHIAIARSTRYQNYFFPWEELLWHLRQEDIVFVGLPNEHEAFEKHTRRKIDFVPTRNIAVLASFIVGAKLIICNQSLPFWIAAGLGAPILQETWESDPNSIIERPNAIYTLDPQFTRTLMTRITKGLLTLPFSHTAPESDSSALNPHHLDVSQPIS